MSRLCNPASSRGSDRGCGPARSGSARKDVSTASLQMTVAASRSYSGARHLRKCLVWGVPQATLDRVAAGVKTRMSAILLGALWTARFPVSQGGQAKRQRRRCCGGSTRLGRKRCVRRQEGAGLPAALQSMAAGLSRSAEGRRRAAAVLRISVSRTQCSAPCGAPQEPELISSCA